MTDVSLGWSALAGLGGISVVCAAATLLVFRRFSDQQAVARAKNLAQAHLLEIRLFRDEPRQVLRSEGALIADQFRLLRLLARPLLILALPMIALLTQLENIYGRVPLRPGEPVVVTVNAPDASIDAPAGIRIETPSVHIAAERQVSWRIRPLHPLSAVLQVREKGRVLRRTIIAGWRLGWVFDSFAPFDVRYPKADILGVSWLIWFFVISTAAGLLLRGPLRAAM